MFVLIVVIVVVVVVMWNGELHDIVSRDKTVMLGFQGVLAAFIEFCKIIIYKSD